MERENDGCITRLLRRWREGSAEAENELFRQLQPELHKLARHFMRRERRAHSLASSDLVNEVYQRLVAAKDRDWESRRHFFAIAARIMRRYLIDHAKNRGKRQFVSLPDIEAALSAGESKVELALTVDQLLDELEKVDRESCLVVELKFFLSLTDQEAADALGLTLRTFQRKWQDARGWLWERLAGPPKQ
jgi:RNA polymerase sigma factor (TIGR02999 family)